MREPVRIVASFASIGIGTFAVVISLSHLAAAQGYDTRTLNESMPPGTRTDVLVVSPQPTPVDPATQEAALRANVATQLAADQALAGSNITVDSNRGTIVLDGTVAEASDIQGAESLARSVPGVINVVNQLRVDRSAVTYAPQTLPDSDLARRVSEQLATSFGSERIDRAQPYGYRVSIDPVSSIDVQADDGQVTLSGIVPSYDSIGRAVSISRNVPGVQTVQTNLQVAGVASPYRHNEDATVEHDVDGFGSGRFAKPMHRPYSRWDGSDGYRNPNYDAGYGRPYYYPRDRYDHRYDYRYGDRDD